MKTNTETATAHAVGSSDLLGAERRLLTAKILSGFCANPAIFASRPDCGWSLCNCTDADLVGYAISLADKVIEADRMVASPNAEICNAPTGAERKHAIQN